MKVESKVQMYELLNRGLFGNRAKANTELHGFKGGVCVRTMVAGGGQFIMCDSLEEALSKGKALGCKFNLSERIPAATLQGEVERRPGGLYLRYTTVDKPMRVAFRDENLHAEGLTAKLLIQTHMDPASWDDLNDLLDTYDGAVVEFSCHKQDVGVAPRRNTIFWEVRHY